MPCLSTAFVAPKTVHFRAVLQMRNDALKHADLLPTHTAIDVGAGTGFTSCGMS